MRIPGRKLRVLFLAGMATLGLLALIWAMMIGSSEAQQGAMQSCPQPGKWAISVWGGDDDTDAGEAFATCGPGLVKAAYYLEPQTQAWQRWFDGRPEISNLPPLNYMQGVVAVGSAEAPVPSPTPTPAAAGFSVLNTSDYVSITGTLHVVGEVRNNNPFDALFVQIEATFFDTADRVVATEDGFACVTIIPAGGDSPFHILLSDPPANIARYTLRAYDEPASEPPLSGLDISVVSTYTTWIGAYHVTGLITNNSSDTYHWVEVCGAFYDSGGKVIRAGFDVLLEDVFSPGESASFDFFQLVDSTQVASYRLWPEAWRSLGQS